MADLLAAVGDLSALIGETLAVAEETFLLELATAAVQNAAGQRIVEVTDDTVDLLGRAEHWLPLPERPVQSVSSVQINGEPVTDFVLRGNRLWRDQGWAGSDSTLLLGHPIIPSEVTVTYTHGFPADDQDIEFARTATLVTAAQLKANPVGATGFSIDDYREQYSQAAAAGAPGTVPESLRLALRRRYGLRTGMLAAV